MIKQFELPEEWVLPKSWGDWAIEERKDLSAANIRKLSILFHEYHFKKKNTRASMGEWELAFRYWVRKVELKPKNQEPEILSDKCNIPGCEELGSISHSTVGGGPWFCQEHFFQQAQTKE